MITYGSVCSGIESATVAWEPLGFAPQWFSQFDPEHDYTKGPDFPSAVLAHHYPNVFNLGDMSNMPDVMRSGALPAPELLVGGTPCQAFSVAGKRGSLADARGGLSLIYGDLLNAIDGQRGAGNEAVCLWENVPGVLNTADNAFGWLLGLLAGEYALADCLSGAAQPLEAQPGASRQKWPKSGCVIGPIRTVAWRVLDAQYFGLAQRRKRVFVVASARKGFDPAEVLFEREGVRRDSPPSREALQEAAGIIREGSHWDDPRNAHPTLNQSFNTGGIGASNQEIFSQRGSGVVGHRQVAFGEYACDETASTMEARGYKDATEVRLEGGDGQVAGCLSAGGGKPGQGCPTVAYGMQVRRLTPVECERLQGFPDNYTNVPYRGKPAPDGQRYKAIGNSKAVPVVRWICLRIAMELLK